jgi:hypothetical protein
MANDNETQSDRQPLDLRESICALIDAFGFDAVVNEAEREDARREQAKRATPEWAIEQKRQRAAELRRRIDDGRFHIEVAEKELARTERELNVAPRDDP